jgi:hypothetical protein
MRIAICTMLLGTASLVSAQSTTALRAQFVRQVNSIGAQPSMVFQKKVTELDKPGAKPELQRYRLKSALSSDSLRMIDTEGRVFSFMDELKVATEIVATDPTVREHFRFSQAGDTAIALREPKKGKLYTDLLVQRSVTNTDGTIRYIFSDIERMSWLYGAAFTIEVWFDEAGRYQRHTLTFWSHLFLQGDQGRVRVEGSLLPTQ